MNNNEIKALILEELSNIAPEIEADDVPDDQDMREALELDSMDFLNLVIAVSKRTQIVIPEADYAKVLTLNAMISYIMNHA
ncbi:phosphopantetheine-binding protein [Psychromonas ingrahamii 37]|uniref:Phosphopantetheine-binding protein n=1 Tax=Psychromonas ingrahamii (strain DSM 17664 / CCUG 51855 / 37) TaxID=357804 RepID=A1T0M2_PSYIN|nr:acyl carrier protein [Psychromonas ingrahamii]ABM05287.1 phosphopantetheine-binding protein [Psychromonas ingrahamii 37]